MTRKAGNFRGTHTWGAALFSLAVFSHPSNSACENESVFHGQEFGGAGLGQGKEWASAQVRMS